MAGGSDSVRVVVIGIGGATSSGKTILSKHLRSCLPGSCIIHQDDFVPPAELLPVDPEHGFQDWDTAATAVDWERMTKFLSELKKSGVLPESHQSLDAVNETPAVPVDGDIIAKWKTESVNLASEHLEKCGEKLTWVIVDGFLMYWDKRIVSDLDVRVFIRIPEDVARARRESRAYVTPEGDTWRDPPQYWEKIVWPAYVDAHKELFQDGDVVAGQLSGKVDDVILFESTETEMKDMVNTAMERIMKATSDVVG
ncbi:hypothetical protein ONZ45_g11922 [Pleurotus djamor]|nr:hypothetical protein ONZ45_g11922 [Pleurotus djamor]